MFHQKPPDLLSEGVDEWTEIDHDDVDLSETTALLHNQSIQPLQKLPSSRRPGQREVGASLSLSQGGTVQVWAWDGEGTTLCERWGVNFEASC